MVADEDHSRSGTLGKLVLTHAPASGCRTPLSSFDVHLAASSSYLDSQCMCPCVYMTAGRCTCDKALHALHVSHMSLQVSSEGWHRANLERGCRSLAQGKAGMSRRNLICGLLGTDWALV